MYYLFYLSRFYTDIRLNYWRLADPAGVDPDLDPTLKKQPDPSVKKKKAPETLYMALPDPNAKDNAASRFDESHKSFKNSAEVIYKKFWLIQ